MAMIILRHEDGREVQVFDGGDELRIQGQQGINMTQMRMLPFEQLWEHCINGRSSPIYGEERQ